MKTIVLILALGVSLFAGDEHQCEHYKAESEKGLKVVHKNPESMNSSERYTLKTNLRKTYNHCQNIYSDKWLASIKKEFTELDAIKKHQ